MYLTKIGAQNLTTPETKVKRGFKGLPKDIVKPISNYRP